MFGVGSFVALATAIGCSGIGGIVTVDPPERTVDLGTLPAEVTFDITVATEQTLPDGVTPRPISSLDLVPNWDSSLSAISGSYHPEFLQRILLPPPPQGPWVCGIAGCFFVYGGAIRLPSDSQLRVGELTLGVPAGLSEGSYRVFVDSDYDQYSSLNGDEGLFGEAFIHVVPEPATLMLLGCGVAAMVISRRRFSFRF